MNKERKEALIRILVGIISGIILYAWWYLTALLFIVNFFITIIRGKREKEIAEFSEYFSTQAYLFFRYITFETNQRPFPFNNLKKMGKFKK